LKMIKMNSLFLLIILTLASSTKIRYDGQKVYRVKVHNQTEIDTLRTFIESNKVDIWAEHPGKESGVIGEIDIRMNQTFGNSLYKLGLQNNVFIQNLQAMIDEENIRQEKFAPDFFSKYRTYQEHHNYLRQLVTDYPNLATLITIGKTVEGREIHGIVITSKVKESKPGIFLNGGQHAREWISPATVAYIAYKLLSGYGNDEQVTEIVDSIEWTIITIVNADGYEYTFSKDRMWRKNRRVNKNSSCIGVDTNRNWAYQWKNWSI